VGIATSASQDDVESPVCASIDDRYEVILSWTKSFHKERVAINTPIPLKRTYLFYFLGAVVAAGFGEIGFALPMTLGTHKFVIGREEITYRHAPDRVTAVAN